MPTFFRMGAAIVIFIFLCDRGEGAAESCCFFCRKIGARRPSRMGVRRKSFYYYFGVKIGAREPRERFLGAVFSFFCPFRVVIQVLSVKLGVGKVYFVSQNRVRQMVFFFC